jgi:hypothetical protein
LPIDLTLIFKNVLADLLSKLFKHGHYEQEAQARLDEGGETAPHKEESCVREHLPSRIELEAKIKA